VITLRNDSKNANEAIVTRDKHIEGLDAKLAALKLKLITQQKATSKYRHWYLDSKKKHSSIHGNCKAAPQTTQMTSQNEQLNAALYDALCNKHKKTRS
jgi:hypothetical protein